MLIQRKLLTTKQKKDICDKYVQDKDDNLKRRHLGNEKDTYII